ncbi:asparagine synthase-related protein [Meridianimaribacter flavus]
MTIKTAIIPTEQTFAKVHADRQLHLEALCVFAAIGFFLDTDTYWKDEVVLKPAHTHRLDDDGYLLDSKPWFEWFYDPKPMTFDAAVDGYASLFEEVLKEQTHGQRVILPLSGGLDSRTQAAGLYRIGAEVSSYSYSFAQGYPESAIASATAKVCEFDFEAFTIDSGYLWRVIDDLAKLNGCYSDFTSPRQMAVIDQLGAKGDVFSLGHWGDVLFDSMGLPQLSDAELVDLLSKKLLKRGGLALASKLWTTWGLDGDFLSYFKGRLATLLDGIAIPDSNAKLRAFKSLYWAPRWTSVNHSVFASVQPITLPYYDERLCRFICTVPETYLNGRQLQIAYIQRYAPELASITWQDQRPFDLNNYHKNRFPYATPYRVANKVKRTFNSIIGKPYVQRNWELQFLGASNQAHLRTHLFESGLQDWIPEALVRDYVADFYNQDALKNAHAINMLLVFAKFNQLNALTF